MVKRIAILALPGVQLLDVSGPLDVFAEANAQAGRQVYDLAVLGLEPEVRSSSGARLVADGVVGRDAPGRLHTLLVAGCPKIAEMDLAPALLAWVAACARAATRFGSVCTGTFLLAAAGLLDARRVTTHWALADAFARRFPAVRIEIDAIHLRDGRVRTAAGVTAGLDLALALVEEDLGREVAQKVAAQLVMFFRRPGGQLQFSRQGQAAPAGRAALQEVQRWVIAEPAADHSVPSLAARTGLSPRHFARIFQQEVGVPPAAWVETARVAAARTLLDDGEAPPKQVAALCGFANADLLRRAFVRHVGISPAAYRRLHAHANLAKGTRSPRDVSPPSRRPSTGRACP